MLKSDMMMEMSQAKHGHETAFYTFVPMSVSIRRTLIVRFGSIVPIYILSCGFGASYGINGVKQ